MIQLRGCARPLLLLMALLTGCSGGVPSNGGGQTHFSGDRVADPAAIWVPRGYKVHLVAEGLNFPTGVTFDDRGQVYVVESGYAYGEIWTKPRLIRIIGPGAVDVVLRGNNGPWNGVAYHDGYFYVAEGGEEQGGRITKVSPAGITTTLVDGIPSLGDHHTNGPVIGPDGFVYFAVGTATNSGVVGLDNYQFGWLKRHRQFHDVPAEDVVLSGVNYRTTDPFARRPKLKWYQTLFPFLAPAPRTVVTGPYSPFGVAARPGQVVRGQIPCSGAVMRVPLEGGKPELVAWGLRNPFGLAFSPDGRLFATENQADVRGSRPVWGTGDLLWEVRKGAWYGWPDFVGPEPLNDVNRYGAPGRPAPALLLARHPMRPPLPVAHFGVHASADGFDFSRSSAFGHPGDAFVAEFGDMSPLVGKVEAPVGFRVVRVEPEGGIIHLFAVNRGAMDAPASKLGTGGFERPIAARFDPSGKSLYVVDFGVVLTDSKGVRPIENTGVLWRISREDEQ